MRIHAFGSLPYASAAAALLLLCALAPPLKAAAECETDGEEVHDLCEPELRHRCMADEYGCDVVAKQWVSAGGLFAGERTVFRDPITGSTHWKLTHDALRDAQDDQAPVWNADGSVMMFTRTDSSEGGDPHSELWLVAADGSWLRSLDDDPSADLENHNAGYFWSASERERVYFHDADERELYLLDYTESDPLGNPTPVYAFVQGDLPPGFLAKNLRWNRPRPGEDDLVFDEGSSGQFFGWSGSYDQSAAAFESYAKSFWACDGLEENANGPDCLHRTRWQKYSSPRVQHQQGQRVVSMMVVDDPGMFLYLIDGTEDADLTFFGLDDYKAAPSHADSTPDGEYVIGTMHDGSGTPPVPKNMWRIDRDTESEWRLLFEFDDSSAKGYHSVTNDGHWVVRDVAECCASLDAYGDGREVSHALLAVSPDGRAAEVLGYHYNSTGDGTLVQTSPDGTKVAYTSDALKKGADPDEGSGENKDLYVAVIRPPNPPRIGSASQSSGVVTVTWSPPLHDIRAATGVWWNTGNEALEIQGYEVWRSGASGGEGTWEQVSELISETSFEESPGSGEFYYVVRAVEHSGLASLFSDEVRIKVGGGGPPTGARRFYQAEHGVPSEQMVARSDWAGAAGGWYLGNFALEPDGSFPVPSGDAEVVVSAVAPEDGSYKVWLRVRHVAGDDVTVSVKRDMTTTISEDITSSMSDWDWLLVGTFTQLTTGDHSLTIALDEDDAGTAGIDMLAFVKSSESFTPAADFKGVEDTTEPATPQGAVGLLDCDGDGERWVELSWDANGEDDLAHYNVYGRATGGTFALENEELLFSPVGTSVTDWALPCTTDAAVTTHRADTAFKYKVTAVDRSGNESEQASVSMTDACTTSCI